NVVAQSDANLAVQVQNTKNDLTAKAKNLSKLEAQQRLVVADVRSKNAKVEGWLHQMQGIVNQIANRKARAVGYAKKVSKAYQAYIRSQVNQTVTYGGGHQGIQMPAGSQNPFQVGPVDNPRAYRHGFGAPRYPAGSHQRVGAGPRRPVAGP